MAASGEPSLLLNATIYLGAAVVAVPLFKRLKLGSVLGYLAAGAVIGPYGAKLIRDAESVLHFAEFGVVLLLFIVGLELKPSRLWTMRRDIFGLGFAQVAISGVLLTGAAYLIGLAWAPAIVAGFGLALSSTAFALQILEEKRALNSPYGNTAFSILLFQDLSIVPLLAVVAFLAPGSGGEGVSWIAILKVLGVVAAIIVAGRFLLNPMFRAIALTRSNEIFTAAALLLVIGTALAVDAVGLSMALGAFLAGVMLSESEYRHQLEADIEPFRGLLLGLFFIAVGMSVNWGIVLDRWAMVLGCVVGLMAVKSATIYILCRLFGSSGEDAQRAGVTLSQGGEFAFVLFSVASANAVMPGEAANILTAVVTISMAFTPLFGAIHEAILRRADKDDMDGISHAHEAERGEVIVAGFGRMGQIVASVLKGADYAVTIIDNDPNRIRIARQFGTMVYFGDVSRADILEVAGAGEAQAIFICVDDIEATNAAVNHIRARFPNLMILTRVYDREHALTLMDRKIAYWVRETFESSMTMAEEGLKKLDCEGATLERLLAEFRHRDKQRLLAQKEGDMLSGVDEYRKPYVFDTEDAGASASGKTD